MTPGAPFGRWTVAGEPYTARERSGAYRRMVPCRCECGRMRDIQKQVLDKRGPTLLGCVACAPKYRKPAVRKQRPPKPAPPPPPPQHAHTRGERGRPYDLVTMDGPKCR